MFQLRSPFFSYPHQVQSLSEPDLNISVSDSITVDDTYGPNFDYVDINYTKYFMVRLEDLLLGSSNPHQNAAMFGLLFEETPIYQQLMDGTPKLACLFKLNEVFTSSNSIDVSQMVLRWNSFFENLVQTYQKLNELGLVYYNGNVTVINRKEEGL